MKNKTNIILIIVIAVFFLLELTGIFGWIHDALFGEDPHVKDAREQMLIEQAYQDGYKDGYSDGLLEVQREAN